MTSNELHQKIADFVADRLNEEEYRTRVRNAVRPCEDCGQTFTRDLVARTALARGAHAEATAANRGPALTNGTTPDDAAIDRPGLAAAAANPQRSAERSLADIVSPVGIVIAVIAVVASLGMLMRSDPTDNGLEVREADEAVPVEVQASQPQNLFNEAVRTFSLVASGAIGVQVSGEKRSDVEEYFTKNGIAYSVRFPQVSLPLTGGIVSRYGDRAFAQLVYSSPAHAVYVIEVPAAELRGGTRLYVTPDILARLEKGERIREMTAEGESLVMFRDGDMVITAVGNMEPAQLERAVRGA
jgi:hypothetical protein